MGRVSTNNVGLSYNIETALGVAGTEWFTLEPNEINTFGATITTVARDPISPDRQRRKGTVTDLDSTVEFVEDTTLSSFRDFVQGFVFADGINTDVTQLSATNLATNIISGFTAFTAEQASKFALDSLIWLNGSVSNPTIGLAVVTSAAVATDTQLTTDASFMTESGNFQVSFAGYRITAISAPTWTWDAGTSQATLTETGTGTALQALGLTPGQLIHVGSIASAGGNIQNAFENLTADDMFGYARVVSISADAVVFDKVDPALQFTDSTAPAGSVDIVFGEFIRNVAVDNSDYLERSFQMEATFPNLQNPSGDEYQYALGNFCNTMAVELPLTDKSTTTFNFVGTDTEDPTTTRKTGADSATAPTQTAALNTSADIARLRITNVDESGLTTDFKSLTLTMNNNVTPEKVLGTLGAKFINTGNFNVDLEAQLLFTNGDVIDAIRANTTVTMDFILKNDDGVISLDIPSLTLGGGDREFPVNESVLINLTGEAFQDENLNTSIGVSLFPIPLP